MKIKNLFYDEHGMRLWVEAAAVVGAVVLLFASVFGALAYVKYRDCPTLCAADSAEPVWTLSKGCGCTKNGELVRPMATPMEVNLR